MSDGPIRVVLVDDDPLVRAGLSLMLGGAPQLQIVGQAGEYFRLRVRQEQPTTPAEDAEMAQAMKGGTAKLPPDSLSRLQELVEKAIAMGTLMDRG